MFSLRPPPSCWKKTLPKAQRTRGLSSACQSKIFRISTKHLLHNLKQTSASQLNFKFKISTKPSEPRLRFDLITFTKHQQQNTDLTSNSFIFILLPKPCAQQMFSFMTKPRLINLQQIVATVNISR